MYNNTTVVAHEIGMSVSAEKATYPASSRRTEAEILATELEFAHSCCCCVNWLCTPRPLGPGNPSPTKAVLYINPIGCPGKRLSTTFQIGCCGGESTEGENASVKQLPQQLMGTISQAVWGRFVRHLLEAQDSVMPNSCLCCAMFVPVVGTHCLGLCYLMKGPQSVLAEMNKVVETYQPFFFEHGLVINIGMAINLNGKRAQTQFISVEKMV